MDKEFLPLRYVDMRCKEAGPRLSTGRLAFAKSDLSNHLRLHLPDPGKRIPFSSPSLVAPVAYRREVSGDYKPMSDGRPRPCHE